MSTHPVTQQKTVPHSALRRLVARHPVAAFLVMAYAVICAVALPPVRTHLDILPFEKPFWESLGTILGVALSAFLVVAAMHGQDGVRDLARRCPLVPLRATQRAHRGGGVRGRDLWSGTAERASGQVAAPVHGGGATAPALDRVLQCCRGDGLDRILAGAPTRAAWTVEGQRHCYDPLCAVASAQLDGRRRIEPRTTPPRPRVGGHYGDPSAVRTDRHDVALQQHQPQRAPGWALPLEL